MASRNCSICFVLERFVSGLPTLVIHDYDIHSNTPHARRTAEIVLLGKSPVRAFAVCGGKLDNDIALHLDSVLEGFCCLTLHHSIMLNHHNPNMTSYHWEASVT